MDELNNDTVVTETEPTVPDDAQTKDIVPDKTGYAPLFPQ